MKSLNDCVADYTRQLNNGRIAEAYRGILGFMSDLRRYLMQRYPNSKASAIYPGYLDMTYFALTPADLRTRNLKIAIVYLHQDNRFELWLSGGNKAVQSEYIRQLQRCDIGDYRLSQALPGVDSILVQRMNDHPDFDDPDSLMVSLENHIIRFSGEVRRMLDL